MTEPRQDDLATRANPPARTAAEEDHSDPWAFAGEDADPPTDPTPADPES